MIKDISNSFKPHPITGDLTIVKEHNSITQEIINLVSTNYYESHFIPAIGCQVNQFTLEPMTSITTEVIKEAILNTLMLDNRIQKLRVTIDKEDNESLEVLLLYYIENNPNPQETRIPLKRIR